MGLFGIGGNKSDQDPVEEQSTALSTETRPDWEYYQEPAQTDPNIIEGEFKEEGFWSRTKRRFDDYVKTQKDNARKRAEEEDLDWARKYDGSGDWEHLSKEEKQSFKEKYARQQKYLKSEAEYQEAKEKAKIREKERDIRVMKSSEKELRREKGIPEESLKRSFSNEYRRILLAMKGREYDQHDYAILQSFSDEFRVYGVSEDLLKNITEFRKEMEGRPNKFNADKIARSAIEGGTRVALGVAKAVPKMMGETMRYAKGAAFREAYGEEDAAYGLRPEELRRRRMAQGSPQMNIPGIDAFIGGGGQRPGGMGYGGGSPQQARVNIPGIQAFAGGPRPRRQPESGDPTGGAKPRTGGLKDFI